MSVSTNISPTSQPRVRRKPAPSLELDTRYPSPDPDDPFAPLSVLRHRTVSNLGSVGAPLSFRGYSTAHLPTLPYTGGRYPPDIYQAYLNSQPTKSASSGERLEGVTAPYTGSMYEITQDLEQSTETPPWSNYTSDTRDRNFLPQRKRSQSAVSRKEARVTTPSPTRNSPYGHSNFQSYILHGARSSTPAFTAEPLPMSPTSSMGHGCESVHSLASPVHSDGAFAASSSPLRQASFSAEVPIAPSKVGKLARLLPKKAGSRLSLARQSTDNLALSPHNSSVVSFPRLSGERSKTKHSSELNTFHARRKSTALFPAEVVASLHAMDVSSPLRNSAAGGLVYGPPTDSEMGYTSDSCSSNLHSPASPVTPAIPSGPRKVPMRSQTTTNAYDLSGGSGIGCATARPLTAPFMSPSAFDEHALPNPRQLMDAASCFVIAENGLRVPFGELFRDQKTIVIFVRHFWCPLCQDYMFSMSSTVDPKLLKQASMSLVVVGCGSYNMIKSYKQIFRTPFAVYTDPSMRLHKTLGMTLKTIEPKALRKRGGYVRHGHMSGIAMVFKNALRVGMPIWERGGDPTQLGGEFILGPGLTVSYAHRMPNSRSHAPFTRVLAAAGVGMHCEKPVPATGITGRSTTGPVVDEELWMEERRLSLARIRERKLARRMGVVFPTCEEVENAEREVILPKIDPPGPLSRSDSIEEKEEGKQRMDMPIQTESEGSNSDSGNRSISTLSSTVEDGDVRMGSIESQTTAESDTSSERTKAEEAGLDHLLDKVELDDCTIPRVVST